MEYPPPLSPSLYNQDFDAAVSMLNLSTSDSGQDSGVDHDILYIPEDTIPEPPKMEDHPLIQHFIFMHQKRRLHKQRAEMCFAFNDQLGGRHNQGLCIEYSEQMWNFVKTFKEDTQLYNWARPFLYDYHINNLS